MVKMTIEEEEDDIALPIDDRAKSKKNRDQKPDSSLEDIEYKIRINGGSLGGLKRDNSMFNVEYSQTESNVMSPEIIKPYQPSRNI